MKYPYLSLERTQMHEPIKDLLTARDLLATSDNPSAQRVAARLDRYFSGADTLESALNPGGNRSAYLKSVGGPLLSLKFCPTGGISPTNAKEYLALGNVLCVGGSWVAPVDLMAAGDWAGIAGLARDAATLK